MTISYGISLELKGASIDDAVSTVTEALAEQGFGVLTTIDVQATLKKKLNIEHRPYRILGACNPQLARRAIGEEPEIGLLLPCNVVVEEAEDGARVSIVDPKAMFSLVDNGALSPVVEEAGRRLSAVYDALKGVGLAS
jgi:uncharacterized protein (DUF302 family)